MENPYEGKELSLKRKSGEVSLDSGSFSYVLGEESLLRKED